MASKALRIMARFLPSIIKQRQYCELRRSRSEILRQLHSTSPVFLLNYLELLFSFSKFIDHYLQIG